MTDYPRERRGGKPAHEADDALAKLNLTLPDPPKPVASYVPARRTAGLLYVSGQLPIKDGALTATGKVPSAVSVEDATAAAGQCVLNAIAIAKAEMGDLFNVRGVVRVGVFVQSDDTFAEQHKVANGASDLLAQIFGDVGRHARAAVGVNALPMNAAVEVEIIFEI